MVSLRERMAAAALAREKGWPRPVKLWLKEPIKFFRIETMDPEYSGLAKRLREIEKGGKQ